MTSARRLVLPALAAAMLAGCGGSGRSADDVLAGAAESLGEIRSGELHAELIVEPREGEPFGFRISGPFELPEEDGLPKLDVVYTQIANGEEGTIALVSDGQRAWSRSGDTVTELDAATAAELRVVGGGEDGGGLAQLDVGGWLVDPAFADANEGADRVTGEVDIVRATNGLLELARTSGRDVAPIEGAAAEQLRKATQATAFELVAGSDDRLLRDLRLRAEFGLDVPDELRSALGDVVGATVRFRLGVRRPNRPVTIKPPE